MRDDRGFTLLEILVATVIAAAMFAVLLETALSGVRTVRAAGAYETAMALARSHLAMLGRNVADNAGDSHGSDGPFEWRIKVTPQEVASSGPGIVNWFLHKDEAHATLYDVTATISWRSEGRQRELTVTTKRLGFALPPPQTP